MKVELRNVKVHKDMSEETTCFSAQLWIDGAHAGAVKNDGQGGSNHYWFNNPALDKAFTEFAKTQPMDPEFAALGVPMDSDIYVENLLNEHLERQKVARWCRTKTVFRLPGAKPGEYRTLSVPWGDRAKEILDEKYKGAAVVLNGTL